MAIKDRKGRLLLLAVTLLLVLGVSLHFCLWKSGMFIDEIYTYGLSNSHYQPFIGHGEGEWVKEQLITRDDFFDYLAVTGEDRFDFGSVYSNQELDVHPPLHYWIINFCSSLAENQFSKWIGLIPDLLIYLGTLVLLFVLSRELFSGDAAAAALCVLFYGLSRVGLSTMLMIRMYVLMTFFTVLLALLSVREYRKPSLKTEIGIGLCICLGLMTQYYFVFYAFFLCACTVLWRLWRKEWKIALRFSLCAFAGVGLMLLCFPAAIRHLTADKLVSGGNAMNNLENLAAWPGRLRYYFGQVRQGLWAAVLCGVLALVCAAIAAIGRRKAANAAESTPSAPAGAPPSEREAFIRKHEIRPLILLLIPVLPTVFIAAVIAPVVEGRYIYNIMPICVLAAGYAVHLALLSFGQKGRGMTAGFVLLGICVCVTLVLSLRTVPEYIYDEHRGYNETLAGHTEDPCVYMTGYYAPITQDMLQLMQFENVYVTEDPASAGLRRYLKEADSPECVVYIDVDDFWGSGFDPEGLLPSLLQETGYSEYEHLYQYALSDTYLLRR